ncbi:MAG: type II toxin-antitoxin system VapC family toxin [Sulfuricellaceae bacterium]
MKYLLDTCFVSELTKLQPDSGVMGWLQTVNAEDLYLSVISMGEIKKGIHKLPISKKKQTLLLWAETLLAEYQDRILGLDLAVMENWSVMIANAEKSGQPVASMDSLIAATAYTHHLTLLTRNERDFVACDIALTNPWTVK